MFDRLKRVWANLTQKVGTLVEEMTKGNMRLGMVDAPTDQLEMMAEAIKDELASRAALEKQANCPHPGDQRTPGMLPGNNRIGICKLCGATFDAEGKPLVGPKQG